jgi:glycine cleavage system aminomethyltransferase T
LGKQIALGYVKRGFNSVGTKLDALASSDSATQKPGAISVEVVPLPFL